ncbi:hypothetical protein OGAPHI_004054 [Ogataea philodendri]|uniref:Uncharacterized protein n=1 Tax=Ogataea philodendri TaxID=1378263 RepID=A0A9P8T4L9_9ASCO|nr:uncharacterized protein OGAPHI_004054 [Ogataea philodendri]KAH3665866.1 hypothetical protein OGAPHI_004054 [Ogataea philodendri]
MILMLLMNCAVDTLDLSLRNSRTSLGSKISELYGSWMLNSSSSMICVTAVSELSISKYFGCKYRTVSFGSFSWKISNGVDMPMTSLMAQSYALL